MIQVDNLIRRLVALIHTRRSRFHITRVTPNHTCIQAHLMVKAVVVIVGIVDVVVVIVIIIMISIHTIAKRRFREIQFGKGVLR